MSRSPFVDIFQGSPDPARGKFLARVFGIFSEDLVRMWCRLPHVPYEDLGRPTVRFADEKSRSTFDFTLRNRASNKIYVAEMKCEIEYLGFRYFVLDSPEQLEHHTKPAFKAFLRAAREPKAASATVGGRPVAIDGAILIWGAATSRGGNVVQEHHHLTAVLTVESMLQDLNAAESPDYRAFLEDRERWLREMFRGLTAVGATPTEHHMK